MAGDWTEAYRRRDLPRAIELGLKLAELAPTNSTCAYNLACAYYLNAQPDMAAQWPRECRNERPGQPDRPYGCLASRFAQAYNLRFGGS